MGKNADLIESPILFKVFVNTIREKAFYALATAEGLDKWFTTGSTIDNNDPGGTLTLRWRNWGVDKITDEIDCPIVKYVYPELFSFKWWSDHYTTVVFTLIEVEDGIIITLREEGYAKTNEGIRRCIDCSVGWGEALTLLKVFLEHGISYNEKKVNKYKNDKK